MTRALYGLLCGVCLMLAACSTSRTALSEDFDRSVKAYNRLLRWHELESAVMTYASTECREESIVQADKLKKRGLAVTDFRVLSTRLTKENRGGDVVTEFDYYILPSTRVKTVSNRQEWIYLEEGGWKIKNGLPHFE